MSCSRLDKCPVGLTGNEPFCETCPFKFSRLARDSTFSIKYTPRVSLRREKTQVTSNGLVTGNVTSEHFLVEMTGKNGTVKFDRRTHIGIKDRKGFVRAFRKDERSIGNVTRLYGQYNSSRYGENRRRSGKQEKSFKATMTPVEHSGFPKPDFIPQLPSKEES